MRADNGDVLCDICLIDGKFNPAVREQVRMTYPTYQRIMDAIVIAPDLCEVHNAIAEDTSNEIHIHGSQ